MNESHKCWDRIAGPVFISIGDQDKLNLFLKNNPKVPRDCLLVDNYTFDAYNTVGFGRIGQDMDRTVKGARRLQFPPLNPRRWLAYLRSVIRLSPIPSGKVTSFPEGVTVLGGTFGVDGNKIVFSHQDGVPGDHPVPREVIKQLIGIKA